MTRIRRLPAWVWLVLVLAAAGRVFAQDPAAGDAAAVNTEPSLVVHFLRSVGWVFGLIFIVLSVSLVALVALLAQELRLSAAVPPELVERVTEAVNQRKFKEAFELARADESFLGRVLATGMARLQYGLEEARDAAANAAAALKSSKDQLTNYVAVIGSLGPYIGLVGTVFGMILSFKVLARSGARVEPQKLADGISHALVVTMVGIGIAVPALFFTVYFRNRSTRIAADAGSLADDLLTQMYHSSKKAAKDASAGEP